MIANNFGQMTRNRDGAVLAEFGIIFSTLIMFALGVSDVALSIIARQQVNSVAAVGSFYAVKVGAVSSLNTDVRNAVATQIIPVRVLGLSTITVSTTTYCACYANGTPLQVNCLNPTSLPVCQDSFGGSTNFFMTPGVYAIVEATAYYSVVFPLVWSAITPLTADNTLPIIVRSYVRIG